MDRADKPTAPNMERRSTPNPTREREGIKKPFPATDNAAQPTGPGSEFSSSSESTTEGDDSKIPEYRKRRIPFREEKPKHCATNTASTGSS